MAKYDGLIIPRTWNEYINKSDGATLSQALQLPGAMDAVPTPGSTKPAQSGGIYTAINNITLVVTSDDRVLTGIPLSQNRTLKVFFTTAQTSSDDTTCMTITYNGTAYPVKACKDGTLVDFVAHSNGSDLLYLQAYTTLELAFDGSQFVVMGNPVVISNADFSIMADGSITYTNKGVEDYGQGRKIVGTLSHSDYFNFGDDCNIISEHIEFWLTIWNTDTDNNIVMHGFYLPNTFMRDGVVANFGIDRTAGNIYGSLVFSGLNQIASKNKFVCYIKNV